MALSLIIVLGGAFIGMTLTIHAVAKSKRVSELMLQQYRDLLAETRGRRTRDSEDETHDPAAPPPVATL